MKKILALLLMASAMQGSLLLGDSKGLYQYVLGGGFDNLDKYLKNSELPSKCLEVSRPWNQLYNALTINNVSDWHACGDLEAEIIRFQEKFLEEVREKKLVSKEEFCLKYFADRSNEHFFIISTVFDPDVRLNGVKKKFDPKVTKERNLYRNALKESIEGL